MTSNDLATQQPERGPGEEMPKRGMRVESLVFFATASFFTISAVVYGFWSKEPAGIVALLLTGLMLAMIATYLLFGSRRLLGARPEDDPGAEVADGAGDVGFFPAASYWPLALASAAMVTAIAIAFWLVWLMVMGFGFLFMALAGWLFEYQRGHVEH